MAGNGMNFIRFKSAVTWRRAVYSKKEASAYFGRSKPIFHKTRRLTLGDSRFPQNCDTYVSHYTVLQIWRQHVPLKFWQQGTKLHGFIQNDASSFSALATVHLSSSFYCDLCRVTGRLVPDVSGQSSDLFSKGQLLKKRTFDHNVPKRVAQITQWRGAISQENGELKETSVSFETSVCTYYTEAAGFSETHVTIYQTTQLYMKRDRRFLRNVLNFLSHSTSQNAVLLMVMAVKYQTLHFTRNTFTNVSDFKRNPSSVYFFFRMNFFVKYENAKTELWKSSFLTCNWIFTVLELVERIEFKLRKDTKQQSSERAEQNGPNNKYNYEYSLMLR
jgi:hypothetical protein